MLEPKTMQGYASKLRRIGRVIVTIDGPAGTGKSTVACKLAVALGLEFLDTGAMYRAASAITIDQNLDLTHEDTIAERVREADLRFDWVADPPELYAFGESINHRLRDDDVTKLVSRVSAIRDRKSVV